MQAIQTTYKGPTNTRASHILVKCDAKTLRVPYDHDRNIDNNHANAAQILAVSLGWVKSSHGGMFGGHLPSGDMAWVFDNKVSLYTYALDPVT